MINFLKKNQWKVAIVSITIISIVISITSHINSSEKMIKYYSNQLGLEYSLPVWLSMFITSEVLLFLLYFLIIDLIEKFNKKYYRKKL